MQEALEHLDPASRALLDLSLRRGMRAEDIAEVLGADADSVVRMCDGALARVADGIGMSGGDEVARTRSLVAELPADAWPSAVAANGATVAGNGAAANGANGAAASSAAAAAPDGEAPPMEAPTAAAPDLHAVDAEGATVEPDAVDEDRAETDEAGTASEDEALAEAPPDADELGESSAEAGELEADAEPEAAPGPAEPRDEEEIDALEAAVAFEAMPEIDVPLEATAEEREAPAETMEPGAAGERARRGRRTLIVAMLLAVVIVAGVVVALTTTGRNKHQTAHRPPPVRHRARLHAPASSGPTRSLAPVAGAPAGADATAQLSGGGRQLSLHVSGLRPQSGGVYEVWLFNSVIDSTPIGRFSAMPAEVTATLPADSGRFRFVDVSLQPGGQTGVHSGVSVLRVPVARLR